MKVIKDLFDYYKSLFEGLEYFLSQYRGLEKSKQEWVEKLDLLSKEYDLTKSRFNGLLSKADNTNKDYIQSRFNNYFTDYINRVNEVKKNLEEIEKAQGSILLRNPELYITEEDFNKSVVIISKAHDLGKLSDEKFEKAKKDITKLQRKVITNKRGHKQTVYVRTDEFESKKEKKIEDVKNTIFEKYRNKMYSHLDISEDIKKEFSNMSLRDVKDHVDNILKKLESYQKEKYPEEFKKEGEESLYPKGYNEKNSTLLVAGEFTDQEFKTAFERANAKVKIVDNVGYITTDKGTVKWNFNLDFPFKEMKEVGLDVTTNHLGDVIVKRIEKKLDGKKATTSEKIGKVDISSLSETDKTVIKTLVKIKEKKGEVLEFSEAVAKEHNISLFEAVKLIADVLEEEKKTITSGYEVSYSKENKTYQVKNKAGKIISDFSTREQANKFVDKKNLVKKSETEEDINDEETVVETIGQENINTEENE